MSKIPKEFEWIQPGVHLYFCDAPHVIGGLPFLRDGQWMVLIAGKRSGITSCGGLKPENVVETYK